MKSTQFNNLKQNYKQYRKFIVLFIVFLVFIMFFYFVSENYRVGNVISRMQAYPPVLSIENTYFDEKKRYKLSDYYIASSYRSAVGTNQKFDYCSGKILKNVIKSGARMVWLDIFNSDMTEDTDPVVSSGVREGGWKLTLNTVPFDTCCQIISKTAFTSGVVTNSDDPFFVCLNLNTDNNLGSLKKIKDSIMKHLGSRLLGIDYGFDKVNISDIPMYKICGGDGEKAKCVIICSDGFENSDLEEIVNSSWPRNIKKINYRSVDPNIKVTEYVKENSSSLKNFNNNNITIITPDEDTFFTKQFNPSYSWDTGCQFVCMYYQQPDKFMEININKFRKNSFVLKPPELRSTSFKKTDVYDIELKQKEEQLKSNDKTFSDCPLTKSEQIETSENSNINLMDDSMTEGLCFIGSDDCRDRELWNLKKHSLHLLDIIVGVSTKDLKGFKSSSFINDEAGYDSKTGDKFVDTKTDLCCATKKYIDFKNRYVLAPSCPDSNSRKAKIGIKIAAKDKDKIKKMYSISDADNDFVWVYPEICMIENAKSLQHTTFCLLSKGYCPSNYNEFLSQNDYRLCCKK